MILSGFFQLSRVRSLNPWLVASFRSPRSLAAHVYRTRTASHAENEPAPILGRTDS